MANNKKKKVSNKTKQDKWDKIYSSMGGINAEAQDAFVTDLESRKAFIDRVNEYWQPVNQIQQENLSKQQAFVDRVTGYFQPVEGIREAKKIGAEAAEDFRLKEEEERREKEKLKKEQQRLAEIQKLDRNDITYGGNAEYKEQLAKQKLYNSPEYLLDTPEKKVNFGSHLTEDLSVDKNHIKRVFRDRLQGIEEKVGVGSMDALRIMNDTYGYGVDLGSKSILGRIRDRVMGRGKMSYNEGLARLSAAHEVHYKNLEKELQEGVRAGTVTSDEYVRRTLAGPETVEERNARTKMSAPEKAPSKGLGLKGKAGAVVGLLALGGIIGNMFSGGHRSNAELYNPNPQPQYYS